MTSVTAPLLDQGTLLGMVGVDISLATLQSLVEEMDKTLYEGQGKVLLSGNVGMMLDRSIATLRMLLDHESRLDAKASR